MQASVIGAMVVLRQILGRICIGFLSDKLGRLNVASLVMFLAGLVSVVVWPNASSYGVLIFFSIFIGASAHVGNM
jgi:MFS family permease